MSNGRSCHALVAETAKAMARAAADEALTLSNPLYSLLKNKYPGKTKDQLLDILAARTWSQLIPQARATLAKMLQGPLSMDLKEQIADALVLDNALPGRAKH